MRIDRLLFCTATLVLFIGCKTNDNQEIVLSGDKECVIVGDIKGLRNGSIQLEDEFGGWESVAEGKVKNRKFVIRTEVSQPTFVFMYSGKGYSSRQVRYFFLEPRIISVNGDFEKDQENGASGTPSNDYWQAYRQERDLAGKDADELMRRTYENAPTDIVRLKLLDEKSGTWSSRQKLELIQTLAPEVLSMKGVSEMIDLFSRRAKAEPDGENVYIDIEQPDPEGNVVSLKEIVEKPGNKYVLVDFWASWCGPCKEEMPFVKDAYEKYHDKGFDIYAVSADNGDKLMAQWRKYIADNGLAWTHVCNNELLSKAHVDYGIQGIPDNVLIDCSDGRIIGRTLRGEDLAARLSELLD